LKEKSNGVSTALPKFQEDGRELELALSHDDLIVPVNAYFELRSGEIVNRTLPHARRAGPAKTRYQDDREPPGKTRRQNNPCRCISIQRQKAGSGGTWSVHGRFC